MEDNRVSNKKLLVTESNEKHRERCDICQRMKNRMEVPVGKLKLSKILEKS